MRLIAIGGSNTLLKGGYLTQLAKLVPEATVINRSIGATNCAMGLYRLMTYEEISAGDIIIWEYALNDSLDMKVRSVEWHLKVVEHTIRYAAEKNALILPVIFAHQVEDRSVVPTAYRAMLHHLCANYGVLLLDIPMETRNAFEIERLPSSDFRDKSHYLPDGRVVKYTAERIINVIHSGLAVPRMSQPIYTNKSVKPVVRDVFISEAKRRFTNSIIDVDYHDLRDADVLFQPELDGARVLAGITLISPQSGQCTIATPDKQSAMTMEPRPAHINMVLLRAVLGGGWATNLSAGQGSYIKFSQSDPDRLSGGPRGILGIITEEIMR